jgi:hypothetical protein
VPEARQRWTILKILFCAPFCEMPALDKLSPYTVYYPHTAPGFFMAGAAGGTT